MTIARSVAATLLLALVSSGCATTKGTVTDDRYHSPLHNFEMPIPRWTGLRIQDECDDEGGTVAFHGDWGELTSVVYIRLPPDKLSILSHPSDRDATYRSMLHDYAMPSLFLRASPRCTILHEESVGEGADRAYFAVLSLPEASTLVDAKTNRRFDATRGLLIFGHDDFLYMVMMQTQWNPAQQAETVESLRAVTASMSFR